MRSRFGLYSAAILALTVSLAPSVFADEGRLSGDEMDEIFDDVNHLPGASVGSTDEDDVGSEIGASPEPFVSKDRFVGGADDPGSYTYQPPKKKIKKLAKKAKVKKKTIAKAKFKKYKKIAKAKPQKSKSKNRRVASAKKAKNKRIR